MTKDRAFNRSIIIVFCRTFPYFSKNSFTPLSVIFGGSPPIKILGCVECLASFLDLAALFELHSFGSIWKAMRIRISKIQVEHNCSPFDCRVDARWLRVRLWPKQGLWMWQNQIHVTCHFRDSSSPNIQALGHIRKSNHAVFLSKSKNIRNTFWLQSE